MPSTVRWEKVKVTATGEGWFCDICISYPLKVFVSLEHEDRSTAT